jgi:hypothetical protein
MVPLKPLIGGLAMAALTALASVVAPSGAAATSVNYLTNGSFEESSGAPDYNHFIFVIRTRTASGRNFPST